MILSLLFHCKRLHRIFIFIIGIVLVGYYLISQTQIFESDQLSITQSRNYLLKNIVNISSNVHIVDLTDSSKLKFQCIKTKTLLHNLTTNICLHQIKKDVYISGAFHNSTSIWEEDKVTRILQLLIRHRNLHFIDIGANIGTYTMFAATLGRFVLAIECFAPNVARIRHAIQLSKTYNQVVIVQNALFTQSGKYLKLSIDTKNIGGQGIYFSSNYSNYYRTQNNVLITNPYIVKTIIFDEALPILIARDVRRAIIKMDIEGSESFVVSNGSHVFDTIDIPFVQMEWKIVRRYDDRVKIILEFFINRKYQSITSSCEVLSFQEYALWPDEIYWVKKNISNFCP